MAFLSIDQLKEMEFKSLGDNVQISDKASFYNCAQISIGSNIRIDDFCVLSAGEGGIEIGNYVHIAVFSSIMGAGKVTLSDFCNVSSRVSIYSSNDDYSGAFLTNPTVPCEYTNVVHGDVHFGRHVIIGSGSIILPNVTINDGAAVGALSLVSKDCDAFVVYAGVPAKSIRNRKKNLLDIEKRFLNANN
ncbi:MAG: galactoside O-acetyltransferase [Zetaproteobacteria bacterium]|nr:MAG: galactoside O-acetyltransferase [Zetaproteobacteria bacterium]